MEMASHDTLEFLRSRLVKDISQLLCKPCTDPRKKELYAKCDEDPIACPCRCETVEPLIARLAEVERALKISAKYLQ